MRIGNLESNQIRGYAKIKTTNFIEIFVATNIVFKIKNVLTFIHLNFSNFT